MADEPDAPRGDFAFRSLFAASWLLGPERAERLLSPRRERLHRKMIADRAGAPAGRVTPVDRVRGLSPEAFYERYFVTGVPVVLEGAAAEWPAVRKWTPEYLAAACGDERVPVLDGQNWKVNATPGTEAVSTTESRMTVAELVRATAQGSAWYGPFIELLDRRQDLRADLDLAFVARYGHTNPRLPWHTRILAKMYVGGADTGTSLHCAGISNFYLQVRGRKKWVMADPRFLPYMYPAVSHGLNWQSRVDFRSPDEAACPLYRYVDRYETVLEPGDVLWNPPFVWHGIHNLTESIAVSLWWTNLTRAFASNFLLATLTLFGRPNPVGLHLGLGKSASPTGSGFRVHLNR